MTNYFTKFTLLALLFVVAGPSDVLAQNDHPSSLVFDFDGNGVIDCDDLDEMTRNADFGEQGQAATPETSVYDVTGEGWLSTRDIFAMIHIVANSLAAMEPEKETLLECELGDFNFNSLVDDVDNAQFNFWYDEYWNGTIFTPFYSRGDINGDGTIDLLDYWYIIVNWDWVGHPDGPTPPAGC